MTSWAAHDLDTIERDVEIIDADNRIDKDLDAVYRAKYDRYSRNVVDPIVSPPARAAALELKPRDSSTSSTTD